MRLTVFVMSLLDTIHVSNCDMGKISVNGKSLLKIRKRENVEPNQLYQGHRQGGPKNRIPSFLGITSVLI